MKKQAATTSPAHLPFLQSILSRPDDPIPRLIFADYLDEAGDPDGELIRLLCEAKQVWPDRGAVWSRLAALTGNGVDGVIQELGNTQCRLLACDAAERVFRLLEKTNGYAYLWAISQIKEVRRWVKERSDREHILSPGGYAIPLGPPTNSTVWMAMNAVQNTSIPNPTSAAFQSCRDAAYAFYYATDKNRKEAKRRERRWQLMRAVEYKLGFVT